tara:strand:- start:47 stop:286 length:240 start_codon:yes stop_codon:yes gene_type:complete
LLKPVRPPLLELLRELLRDPRELLLELLRDPLELLREPPREPPPLEPPPPPRRWASWISSLMPDGAAVSVPIAARPAVG